MTTRKQLRQRAKAEKLLGMTLAAGAKLNKVPAGKVAMLRTLLVSPDGTVTIDDATADLAAEFHDGGKWRGTVCRSLATSGIIERVAVVKSNRPSRHRGYVTRWRLRDRQKAALLLSRLVAAMDSRVFPANELTSPKSETPSAATNGVSVQITLPEFEKGFTDGQTY